MLISLFERCMKRRGVKESDPYDWEKLDTVNTVIGQTTSTSQIQGKKECIHGNITQTTVAASNASGTDYLRRRNDVDTALMVSTEPIDKNCNTASLNVEGVLQNISACHQNNSNKAKFISSSGNFRIVQAAEKIQDTKNQTKLHSQSHLIISQPSSILNSTTKNISIPTSLNRREVFGADFTSQNKQLNMQENSHTSHVLKVISTAAVSQKTKPLRSKYSSDELAYAAQMKLRASGNAPVAQMIKEITEKKDAEDRSNYVTIKKVTPSDALSLPMATNRKSFFPKALELMELEVPRLECDSDSDEQD